MNEKTIKAIQEISSIENSMFHQDFFLTWEKKPEELGLILSVAEILRQLRNDNLSSRLFDSGLAVSLFRDKSTRTRFSFASACNLLGLEVQDLDEEKSQIAHGETVRETANMISFMTDIIGIRDDMFLGEGNRYMREVGEALDDGFSNGVLPQRPGIVNLQCDLDHPTQSMADLLHLVNYFGSVDQLRGKKIAMTWAYSPSYGKPLSVPQGVVSLMTRFGMDVHLAHPEGYELLPEVLTKANDHASLSGGSFQVSGSMEEAFRDADIVYPKSWAPISVMHERTKLLKDNDKKGLSELEKKGLEQNRKFTHWECNEEKMKLTRNGKALYMHCLPADISGVSCEQGEADQKVFDRYRLQTYIQAGYKPYIIAAMILTNRFSDPSDAINKMLSTSVPRIAISE